MKRKNKNALPEYKDKYAAYRGQASMRDKPENFMKSAGKLFGLLKGRVTAVIFTVICACVSSYLSILGPDYLGKVIDVLALQIESKINTGVMDFKPIEDILLTILLVYAGSSLLSFFQHYIMAGVVQNLITKLRRNLNLKLSKLPLSYFDSHTKGDILSRMTNDIDNVNDTLQHNMIQIITSVVTFVGVFVIMMRNSVMLSLTSLSPFPVCLIIALTILNISKGWFRKQWKTTGDINGHIEEMFTGHAIVKAFSYEKRATDEFDLINEALSTSAKNAQFYSGILGPLINFANNAGYVVICVLGGYLILTGKQSVGAITTFMMYTKLLMQPIIDLSNIANNMQSSLASAERVFNVLSENEESVEMIEKELSKGEDISFENVCFSYLPEKPLIENFNLEVKKGQLTAIVGPTGAGKTTIVNLLMRFYDIDKGAIKIDGTDIRAISRKNLRNLISMVLQDTWLFAGTIRDNIMYSNEKATEEDFMNAVRAARVDSFVNTFSDGYDTVLEEDGANLSAGQKQLITIARAILSDPQILILDEATSSVDTRTELQIQEAMNNLMKGRTNFVIAHRLSTIVGADNIIVMNEGKIVETGRHKELLQKDGFYANLYNSQFSNEQ